MNQQSSPTIERLDDQIAWYDRKSRTAQRWYKSLKLVQIATAALLPLIPLFDVPHGGEVAAVLGVAMLILEGVQQLNQYQQNWVAYRSTCEALKHEKYLYLAGAGPYAGTESPLALLADRIEGLISQEHAKWVSAQEQAAKAGATPTKPAAGSAPDDALGPGSTVRLSDRRPS
jgi:hypothetical protein